jgi:hypothetical protein
MPPSIRRITRFRSARRISASIPPFRISTTRTWRSFASGSRTADRCRSRRFPRAARASVCRSGPMVRRGRTPSPSRARSKLVRPTSSCSCSRTTATRSGRAGCRASSSSTANRI